MSCPNCDHTMQGVENCAWWCPRCGTLVVVQDDFYTPKLVTRCRGFAETFKAERALGGDPGAFEIVWQKLGIAESINVPEERTWNDRGKDVPPLQTPSRHPQSGALPALLGRPNHQSSLPAHQGHPQYGDSRSLRPQARLRPLPSPSGDGGASEGFGGSGHEGRVALPPRRREEVIVRLTFDCGPEDAEPKPAIRIRWLLKYALRSQGLRCIDREELREKTDAKGLLQAGEVRPRKPQDHRAG